jgi:hypothetical protein
VLEIRAAEEPLRSGLDVKGIKAQVLRRIEKLEEREDLLSEILPEMEARGHDMGGDRWVEFGRPMEWPRLGTVAPDVVPALGYPTSWKTSSLRGSLFTEFVNRVRSKVA